MSGPKKRGAGRPPTYPLGALDINGSFFIPRDHPGAKMVSNSRNVRVARSAYTFGATHGKKFNVHKEECGGYTVRRTQ